MGKKYKPLPMTPGRESERASLVAKMRSSLLIRQDRDNRRSEAAHSIILEKRGISVADYNLATYVLLR